MRGGVAKFLLGSVLGFALGRLTSREQSQKVQQGVLPVQSPGVAPEAAVAPQVALLVLSTASREQLQTLPGVGEKIAEAIIGYRAFHGPFTSLDELEDVPMIGADEMKKLRGLIRP